MKTFFKLYFIFFISVTNYSQTFLNDDKLNVFILAGQSNMSGAADALNLTKEDLNQLSYAQKNISIVYNGNKPIPLSVTIPPNWKKKKFKLDSCFGPEIFFGIELSKKYPTKKFLFIKRSKGGSSLYGSWNPNWTKNKAKYVGELNKPKLFYDLVNDTNKALSKYKESDYQIRGMLWVQGESDSSQRWGPLPSETYFENLKNLINASRIKFKNPKMPFMIMQVGSNKIVKAMKNVSNELNNVIFIPQSKDKSSNNFLSKREDNIHYNYLGMKKIGILFSQEFNKINNK